MLCLQTAVQFSRLHMHVKRRCPSLHSTCRRRLWRILTAPSLYISLHFDMAKLTNKSVATARPHPMSHCNAATSAATTRAAAAAMLFVVAVLATAASAVAVVGAGLAVVVVVVVAFAPPFVLFEALPLSFTSWSWPWSWALPSSFASLSVIVVPFNVLPVSCVALAAPAAARKLKNTTRMSMEILAIFFHSSPSSFHHRGCRKCNEKR